MKVALYARVSSDVQEYERQISDLTNLVKKEGHEIFDIYHDKISGFKDDKNRPDLNRLLKLTKNEIQAVYISEFSRLSRNPTYLRILIDHFTELGINVFSVGQNVKTLNNEGFPEFTTDLMIAVLSQFASYEIKTKNERVKSGKKECITVKGNSYTYKPPFGYKNVDKKLVIHETEAEVIKDIFTRYSTGESIKELVQYLNLKKIPTRNSDFMKKTEFKVNKTKTINKDEIKWGKSSVRNILRNTVYCGYKEIKGEKVDAQAIKLNTPAIITEELFTKCQDEIKGRIANTDKSLKNDFMLRGLFVCGECGKQFLGSRSHGDLLYKCADKTHVKSNSYTGCKNASIYKIHVEEMIWTAIKDAYQRLRTTQVKEGNISNLTNNIEAFEIQINAIDAKLSSLIDETTRMIKLYAKGTIPDELIEIEQKRINSESDALKKTLIQIKALKLNDLATKKAIEEMNSNPFDLVEIERSYHLQKAAVREILNKVVIYKIDNKFTVFELIFKAGYTLNLIRETWSKKYILVDSYNLTFNNLTKLYQNNTQVEMNDLNKSLGESYHPETLFRNYSKYPEFMELGLL